MKNTTHSQRKTRKAVIILLILAVIGLLFYAFASLSSDGIDTSDWETYTNEEYGFSIDHPRDWEVFEGDNDPIADKFNIYKPTNDGQEPAFTHHSDVTHVSVFPQGIPTEGVSGETTSTNVDFDVPTTNSRDYTLSDGTRFATYANITPPTDTWDESAFLFANVEIQSLETECFRDGDRVADDACDVLTGDTLVRHGEINETDRAIEVLIMESLRFTDGDNDDDNGNGNGVDNEDTDVIEHDDLIRVFEPDENDTISSPLRITGEARGQWYFEASFPVRLIDANGNNIPINPGFITADGEWMTESYVPFDEELTFTAPATETGTLILERSNPSGLPENADELRIPVRFGESGETQERGVKLYYYNPELDEDENGNIMCSAEGLVAVDRDIPVTQTPIQDTIRLLLEGDLTSAEEADGITTEFPLNGFELTGAVLSNGTLTLSFNDPNNATSGGSCRAGILWHQIKATAEQFDAVDEARFEPETLFQP